MSTDVRSYKHKLHHLPPRSSAAARGALIYLPRLSLMQFRCCHITVLLYSSSFIFSLTASLSPSAENETQTCRDVTRLAAEESLLLPEGKHPS